MLEKLNHYVKRLSVFLITVALIVGMVGCGEVTPPTRYNLTMAVAPAGNGTATDLTNASPYTAGTVVGIKAVAAAGYRFVNWTAPAGTFVNANATQTTFTMPAQNITVTANFVEGQLIRDWYDLHAIRNNLGGSYLLTNDLDSTTAGYEELASETANEGKGWEPIGTFDNPFTWTFDGQGYEIRDLFINRPDENDVGLFGYVGWGGVIKNLGVVNVTVTGQWSVGGLVGRNSDYGTVSNSYSTGSVSGDNYVGGLVGGNYYGGNVTHSYSTGSVTGNLRVGGLVGGNYGIVSNSYSTGNVSGDDYVGGLVGYSYASVSNSYSTGNVTGNEDVGGLVGYNQGSVSNSFWDTKTSGQATSDGGTGKNTTEMQDIDTFSDAAWDIVLIGSCVGKTWYIDDGNDYPRLCWQS
jgi:uncharacterized repeat protein (TIGR02543 family)